MRAKEYLEINKSSLSYADDIKRVIVDLMPLRKDKVATDKYYNRYLLSDWRLERFKQDMQDYNLNNGSIEKPSLETFEGEISAKEANLFRGQLFDVIQEDKSFGYLFYQLGVEKNQKNAFYKNKPIQCVPDESTILSSINRYRDDYPKQTLDEFIDDALNYEQYSFLTENNIIENEPTTLLDYFNTSYLIYDEVRCIKNKLSQVNQYCKNFTFPDDLQKYWVLSFVSQLIAFFEKDDVQLERCRNEILKIIRPLEQKLYPQGVPTSHEQINESKSISSNIYLSSAKGKKVNFIRVINCLYELGFFKDQGQNSITKKEVFETFGQALNIDLSTYQNDLSVSKSTANRDMKSTIKIFEEMLEKQREINQ